MVRRGSVFPKRLVLAVLVAALALQIGVPAALAHARLIRGTPASDALLQHSPARVTLVFSEDLNGLASRIVVWDRYRHPETVGTPTLVAPRELTIGLKPLKPGSYLVLWTSVSAQDGHLLRGSYLFSVKVRGPGPSLAGITTGNEQTFPDPVGLVALLSHWIELLAAVIWGGAAAFSAFVLQRDRAQYAERERSRTRTLLLVTLPCLFVASTILMATNAYGIAGNDWGNILQSTTLRALLAGQYGQLWIGRQIVVLLALAAIIRRRPLSALTAVLSALYLYLLAASGHAASAEIGVLPGHITSLLSVSIAADWLHLLADAVWLGGQVYIAAVLIPALLAPREGDHRRAFLGALDRFSPAAYASIAAYAISGVFAAEVQIPSWYAYFYSPYGRALILKMALIGAMMLVSGLTVYVIRPRLRWIAASGVAGGGDRLMRRLVRWLHVNPVLGAGVLLATSVMFYYPVPVGFGPPGPSQYVVRNSDYSITLSITPDRSGPNRITVLLRDRQGRPVQQAQITVLTTMLDMVMGTGLAAMQEKAPGRFVGTTDLGMGGRWRLQVLVYTPAGLSQIYVDVRVGA